MNWIDSVFSDGSSRFVSNPNPKLNETIHISIRMFKTAPIKRVYFRYLKNGEETVKLMDKIEHDSLFIYYSCSVKINQPVINYHFILFTEDKNYSYNQLGLYEYTITEDYDFRLIADFDEPAWVKDSIFYQIFVDRFYNGCKENDVSDNEYSYDGFTTKSRSWDEKPGDYKESGNLDFFGGDLEGIEQKVNYLKALGINTLYLNPIFDAPSNHKYDCRDYFQVDAHFGGNEALQSLMKSLHENGMKAIVDISINHTGDTHNWLREEPGYYFMKGEGQYECWCDVKSLPILNYGNNEVKNIMYKYDNSVLKFWMKEPYEIDGWRLDVGHNVGKMNELQVDSDIWREVRHELKELNPQSFLVAEHWTDCSKYLQGDMWDSTMNYFGFLRPVRKYLGENDKFLSWKIDDVKMTKNNARVFKEEVTRHYGKLPFQLQNLQLNLLSSHDLHRIHTSHYIDKQNVLTAIIMLFTFHGVPCIYYGDEVGLPGELNTSGASRFPMEWNEKNWDMEINKLYIDMIKLRKTEKVLSNGSFKILYSDDDTLSYARFDNEEAVIFINSQAATGKKIKIPVSILGKIEGMKQILGYDKSISRDHDNLYVTLNSKQTLLLKANFK